MRTKMKNKTNKKRTKQKQQQHIIVPALHHR